MEVLPNERLFLFSEDQMPHTGKENPLIFVRERPAGVAQYNEFASNSEQADTSGIRVFLEKLSCKREDWQVLQAENAISLYEYYMKSLPLPKSERIDRASAEKTYGLAMCRRRAGAATTPATSLIQH